MFVKHKCPFPNTRIGLTFDLDLSSTDLNINKDHLLIKDYLTTKFEAFWAEILSYQLHKVWGDQHDVL